MIYWFIPNYNRQFVVMDIFVKTKDEAFTYWQAKDKVMRVDKKYYHSLETISYLGNILKISNQYEDYLTGKYGDWSISIKEGNCSIDERTAIN